MPSDFSYKQVQQIGHQPGIDTNPSCGQLNRENFIICA